MSDLHQLPCLNLRVALTKIPYLRVSAYYRDVLVHATNPVKKRLLVEKEGDAARV